MKRKIEAVAAAAVIAGFGFFAASHVQPSYAYKKRHHKVTCTQSGIHMTMGVDGKTWVATSSTVCTNGNFKLEGKVK